MRDLTTNDQGTGQAKSALSLVLLPTCSSGADDGYSASSQASPRVIGTLKTAVGDVPIVDSRSSVSDVLGSWAARWGFRRMKYRVAPGLYAVGSPSEKSYVFVSANYRMSFDRLRGNLAGLDAWILVIDTKGINVWCAAGKGTFGTAEIIARVAVTGLPQVVKHRQLILPQLAGPGVAAHKVKEATGFQVVYGPVRATDIKPFLEYGMKATDRMRRVTFTLRERLALIPYELVHGAKWALAVALMFLALSGVSRSGFSVDGLSAVGPASVAVALLSYVAGVVLPPILLPWLPGRAFSLKGLWVGLLAGIALIAYASAGGGYVGGEVATAGWLLIIPATTSFLAMNFTGCSTYTSLSGVKWEMKRWLPWQIGAASVGMILWIVGRFV